MSRVLDEKFEGAGYQESWSETVGTGCTLDEDAATSDTGSPSGSNSQCLKVIGNGSNAVYAENINTPPPTTFYFRVEIYLKALSGQSVIYHSIVVGLYHFNCL